MAVAVLRAGVRRHLGSANTDETDHHSSISSYSLGMLTILYMLYAYIILYSCSRWFHMLFGFCYCYVCALDHAGYR